MTTTTLRKHLVASVVLAEAPAATQCDEIVRRALGRSAFAGDHVQIGVTHADVRRHIIRFYTSAPEWTNQVLLALRVYRQEQSQRFAEAIVSIHLWHPVKEQQARIVIVSILDWHTLLDFNSDMGIRLVRLCPREDLTGYRLGVPPDAVDYPSEDRTYSSGTVQPELSDSELDAITQGLLAETAATAFIAKLGGLNGAKTWSPRDEQLFAGRCRVCRLNDAIWWTAECRHPILCLSCVRDYEAAHFDQCLACQRESPTLRPGPSEWTEEDERQFVGCCRTCRRAEAIWFTTGCDHACYCDECYRLFWEAATPTLKQCPICQYSENVAFIDITRQ